MLVITRRIGESVKIGDDITVYIMKQDGKQVKMGIEAPREVLILRSELNRNSDREKVNG